MQWSTSTMQMPVVKSEGKKHYSFLNPLDDIRVPSANLSLAPSLMLEAEKEASIKRLSAALHTLSEGQNSKQLPALPIPSYDNGVSDLGWTHARDSTPATSAQNERRREQEKDVKGFRHIPRISLGEGFSTTPFAELTSFHVDRFLSSKPPSRSGASKTSHKRTSSEAGTLRPEKRVSARTSRPISMYSMTRRQTVTDGQRPTTSMTNTETSRDRKKSITYSDQRCAAPLAEKEQSRPATATQSPRRRFKIPASFKDLHFKSERRRRLQQKESPPPPLPTMRPLPSSGEAGPYSSSQLTIQKALASSPAVVRTQALLHDESESKKFTRECVNGLALKPDPPKRFKMSLRADGAAVEPSSKSDELFGPHLPVQSATLPRSFAPQAGSKSDRPNKHAHRFSEAESISSSILDYDWPQPEAYRTTPDLRQLPTQDHGRPRPDSGLGGLLNVMSMSNGKQGPFYPPPSGALPPTPGPRSRISQTKQYYAEVTSSNLPPSSVPSNILLPPVSFGQASNPESNSRLSALAATKGLHMDLSAINTADTSSSDGEDAGPVLTSPLRLRSQRSNRSVRIDSLRRKHLSIHGRDGISQSGSGECYEDAAMWARRGSAPDKMQSVDSLHRMSKQSFHRRCTSNDKNRRTSQCLSPLGRHTRQNNRSSTAAAMNTGRVQKANKTSARSSRISISYQEVFVNEPNGSHNHSRRHSRQYSAESQPSTARSSASTAMSTDTEVTLPSPTEDTTMTLNTIVNHPYYQNTTRVRSPLVPDFEIYQDGQPRPVRLPQTQNFRQATPSVRRSTIKPDGFTDGIGRSQRNTPLQLTRSSTEQSLHQQRDSKKRQARAQLAHDLQFELEQLEQMKRVYRAMHSARDRDRASGQGARTYAQLLDDDRFAVVEEIGTWSSSDRVKLSTKRTSHIIAKIEADLKHSPPKYQRSVLDEAYTETLRSIDAEKIDDLYADDTEVIPPPVVSPVKARSTSPLQPPHLAKKPRTAGFSLFPNDRTPPKAQNTSPASGKSSTDTSFKSSQPKKPKSPSSTISSFDSKKSRKRYSLTSVYNSTTPQYSPTSSVFSEYRTPGSRSYSRQQQLTPPPEGRELHIAATIMSPQTSQNLNVDALNNSSSKMDQVLDTFIMTKP